MPSWVTDVIVYAGTVVCAPSLHAAVVSGAVEHPRRGEWFADNERLKPLLSPACPPSAKAPCIPAPTPASTPMTLRPEAARFALRRHARLGADGAPA